MRSTGPGCGLVITGAAGVGKSRLAREALAANAHPSHWVAATKSAQEIPLGALARWLPGSAIEPGGAVRAVAKGLLGAAGGQRVVVVVDDAYLLDEQSAFLLQQILDNRLATLILTVRDGEVASPTIEALWQATGLERIDLPTLGKAEMTEMLQTRLGGPVNSVSSRKIWELTRGNPLYIRHLVDHWEQSGQLENLDGIWTLTERYAVPVTLSDLIGVRMRDLPPAVSDVVDLLAVGEPISATTLTELVGADAVEEAQSLGLVTAEEYDGDLQLALVHPMFGEARRATTGQFRLRRLRSKVARTLQDVARIDHRSALRRGVLILDSDVPPDPAEMTRAADVALWLFDPVLGMRFANAAVQAGGGWYADLSRITCLINIGANDDADIAMAELACADLPDEIRSQVSFLRIWNLQTSGRVDEAAAMLSTALPAQSAEPGPFALRVLEALNAACGRRPAQAVAGADAGLASEVPTQVVFIALQAKAVAEADLGRFEALDGLVAIADSRSADIGAGSMFMSFLDIYAYSQRMAGRLAQSRAAVERTAGIAESRLALSWAELMIAAADLAEGRAEAAARRFRHIGLSRPDFPDSMGWLYRARIDFAQACAISGDVETADSMLALINAAPHMTFEFLEPQRVLSQAWLYAAQGRISAAVETARQAAENASAHGQLGQEVVCLQLATRFGDATTARRLDELEALVTGPRVVVAAEHARALAAGDGAALDAAAGSLLEMGDRLAAIDVFAQAAVAHRRAGRRGSALASAANARQAAQECGPVHTPALLRLHAPPKFSDRRLEIVALMADGRTNRDIADLLGLSVRTVESHIYQACNVMGVSDRTALAQRWHSGRADSQ